MSWMSIISANTSLHAVLDRLLKSGENAMVRTLVLSHRPLLTQLRELFERYFPEGERVTYAKARQMGLDKYLGTVIKDFSGNLGSALNKVAEKQLGNVFLQGIGSSVKALEKLPVPTVFVPDVAEKTQRVVKAEWKGATMEDRLLHITDDLAGKLSTTLRTGLFQQESYDAVRQRVLKLFGATKRGSVKPSFAAYGSAKVYRNEARRAWNQGIQEVYAENEDLLVRLWRSVLIPTTTPDCAAFHGRTIDDLGIVPPRHVNCMCNIFLAPNAEVDDVMERMAAERDAWFKKHGIVQPQQWKKLARKKTKEVML